MKRILIYGPPLSGKTTMLEAFAEAAGLRLARFEVHVPHLGIRGAVGTRADGVYDGQSVEVSTLSGSVFDNSCWSSLVVQAASAIVVLDPQPSQSDSNAAFIAQVDKLPDFPTHGCLVHSKQDIVPAATKVEISRTRLASWPQFRSRSDRAHDMLAPLEWAIRGGVLREK